MDKTIYTKNDINKLYSSWVKDYLDDGYVINTASMSGTQTGEISKVDFSKDNGKTVIRVLISYELDGLNDVKFHYESVNITKVSVILFENADGLDTLWNNRGIVLLERVFYHFDRESAATEDLALVKNAVDKKYDRFYAKRNPNVNYWKRVYILKTTDNLKKIAEKMVRKQNGFKTSKFDIVSIEKDVDGKAFYITVKKNSSETTIITFKTGKVA